MKRLAGGLPVRPRGVVVLAAFLIALAVAGCGGGGETTVTTQASSPPVGEQPTHSASAPAPASPAPKAEKQPSTAPAGKTATRASRSENGKPLPPAASQAAREAGREACGGMTAIEAAKHFEIPARLAGVDKKFAEFVAEPPPSTESSSGYPRLVAALYASTLPAAQREEAAAGCAEELTPPNGG